MNVAEKIAPRVEDFARQWCDETQFALKKLLEVSEQRHDRETMAQCRALQHTCVRTLSLSSVFLTQRGKRKLLDNLDSEVLQLAEKLRMVINLEMRETVWALPEVKQSTHKFATASVPFKYLRRLPEKPDRLPEELVAILRRQIDEIEVALRILRKHERKSQKNRTKYFGS